MQTSLLLLVSGIHRLSPDHEAELAPHFRKGTYMSKTASIGLLPSSTPVRPPDGLDRPPADREQPHRHPQRRPPPFRSLSPENCRLPRRRDQTNDPAIRFIRINGPGFRGHFRLRPIAGFTSICDKSAAWRRSEAIYRLHSGISHTKMPSAALGHKQERIGGWARAVRNGQPARWGGRHGQMRAPRRFIPAIQSTIGRKERMPRRKVPRYNSNLQPSA